MIEKVLSFVAGTSDRCASKGTTTHAPGRTNQLLISLLVWVALVGLDVTAHDSHAVSSYAFPVKLSANGKHVTDQTGRPFFLNGDTAWSLIPQLTQTEVDAYLSDRAQKGYNAILVNLIEHSFATNAPANRARVAPFNVPGDFSTPNEAYFTHADWVIGKAAEKGILVLIAPLYLGYQCGAEGWCADVKRASLTTIRNYGRYVGSRYKSFSNIVWVIGGDADPVANGVAGHMRELVNGILENDATHLVTAHNAPEQAAMDAWSSETWLKLNNVYTYGDTYPSALTQYGRTDAKPLFLLESAYENERNSTPLSLRRQAYWTVLSGGAVGHLFGNCPIWHFNAPSAAGFCSAGTWQSQLNSAGSTTLAYVGTLFQTRAFHLMVPDLSHTVLTSGYQSGANYAAAARASDGSTVIAYVPSRRTVVVDMSRISGVSARAWWFNPRTSLATQIGVYPTSGATSFTPPDNNDWVLVIDNATLNLPPPGSSSSLVAPVNLRIVQ